MRHRSVDIILKKYRLSLSCRGLGALTTDGILAHLQLKGKSENMVWEGVRKGGSKLADIQGAEQDAHQEESCESLAGETWKSTRH